MQRGEQSTETVSKTIMETVNGSHSFTIKGYSLSKGMGPGKYVTSDVFKVGGYDWAVYFYPDGKNAEDSCAYVSVFIALASEGTDVRALFELSLLDQSGNGKHKVNSHFDRALESGPYSLKYKGSMCGNGKHKVNSHFNRALESGPYSLNYKGSMCGNGKHKVNSHFNRTLESGPYSLNYKGSMWGYKRFFRRTSLEISDYVKDDCLLMHCTVGVVRNRLEGPKKYSISVPPSNIGQDLMYLLDSEVCCDILFRVGDENFKAHKMILAARSPVFRAQFYGLIGNPNMDEVVLQDLEPFIFKAMLLFIYSDKLPDLNEISGSTSVGTTYTIMMQHLLATADRFGLERLKQLCEAKLCEDITTETVATTLPLAEQHRCPQLKAICLKFAASNLGAVMQIEGFKDLEESCPSLLSELLETVATVDEKSELQANKKRSSSSIIGIDLAADGAVAEFADPSVRHQRRRL